MLLVFLSSIDAPPAAAASPAPSPTSTEPAARYLVRYAHGVGAAEMVSELHSHKVGIGRTFSKVMRGAAITATPAQVAGLKRSGRVAGIEPDHRVSVSGVEQPAPWGLDRIDQANLPLSGSFSTTRSGAGVKAYVVDTGVLASHTDLAGRVAAGWTAVADGRGAGDCNGHGTHVAGTIAGTRYGVAKAASVVPVRVLDCAGSGYDSDVIAGLDWVASDHQAGTPAIVNLSLGGPASTMLDSAIQGVIDDGVTAVVAAGNSSTDACAASPARVPQALTVAATDTSDRQADFSNFGPCVDLYAPGVGITSDGISSTTATAIMSGTSMASPHVAGAAALLLEQDPGLAPTAVATRLLAMTSAGVVTSPSAGTPNRLLNTTAATTTTSPAPTPAPTSVPAPTSAPAVVSHPSISSGADVVAARSDGVLWVYPANGKGGFLPRTQIGSNWLGLVNGFVTDWNRDGVFDLIAQWKDGHLSFHPGKASGGFERARTIGSSGWAGYTLTVGTWRKADRFPGIVAHDPAGTLWFYGNSGGSGLSARIKVDTGWRGLYMTMTDFDQDGAQDILAKRSDGTLALYRSTGAGRFIAEARRTIGASGWNSVNSITGVAGYQGAGSHGLVSRYTNGKLAYYPYSKGSWGTRSMIGSGWGTYTIFR
ncbi:S8 family serine peptidase [Cryobacterium tepidiphilum]|uniref:S8 family serine peptidase n=1 Tax=Cryobacterium tepidiphilum TaxID=2486026 RepID=UPI001F3B3597|nr:S8 family serine peptidase [Cryobacterium tepidiphilum]